ncbi:MAG: 50S ribosomal protein L3 [Saprospiraceae bacterium]|nr:50S ribosomal protein L3 [Saprospiraceae bacterium]
MNGIIGRKIGMTSIFNEDGRNISCTIVEAQPNVVTQVKTEDTDGYYALQLSFAEAKARNLAKGLVGHFEKAGTTPKRRSIEFRDCTLDKNLGDSVSITDIFEEGDTVRAVGRSKGKGFQGVVKRYNFRGVGDATHGQHNRLRAPGSIGAASYPAKVVKGMKMAGRMGNDRVTVKNLKVVKILEEKNLLLIKGAIPGHKGSIVVIEK